jgi:hypothetical protein
MAVVVVLLGAALIRTYRLSAPLGDWHSWRQADTASVTREYVKQGIDLLHPQYHDVSNIPSGLSNPQGWRMVEFPIINAAIAQVLLWFPSWSLVVTSRVFSIVASLVGMLALYGALRRLSGRLVALTTLGLLAFLPFYVYYSRVILPEPFLVMFLLMSLWMWTNWVLATKQARPTFMTMTAADGWLVGTGVSFALALLLKPMALFYLPVFATIAWRGRWSPSRVGKAVVVVLLSCLPLYWWRHWITQYPAGIPASSWLFNSNHIRLRPSWWHWLFADRIGRQMFGFWGAPFLLVGLLPAPVLVLSALGSTFAYLVVIATGNVQHDYYQVLIFPLLALAAAHGIVWVWRPAKGLARLSALAALSFVGMMMLSMSWFELRGNFNVNNPAMVTAGAAVDRLTPPNALVIAPYGGDTAFLFQTNRRGWPIGYDIADKIARGAQFYVTLSQDDEANALMKQYPVLEKTKEYIILDLRRLIAPPAVVSPLSAQTVRK